MRLKMINIKIIKKKKYILNKKKNININNFILNKEKDLKTSEKLMNTKKINLNKMNNSCKQKTQKKQQFQFNKYVIKQIKKYYFRRQ